MSYVTYENYSFVIRENTGSTRILAALTLESVFGYDQRLQNLFNVADEYVRNHAKYEAINPLWIGVYSYSSEPDGAPPGYACVWAKYTEGNSESLSRALGALRISTNAYIKAAEYASSEGGIAYAKDYFTNCLPRTQQLDTPTDLTATNITNNSADLGWSAIENASNYRVDYRIYGDTLWQQTTSN